MLQPTKEYPVGLHVWAKMDEHRPWPARVIQKRKGNTQAVQQGNHLPVMFYGEEDEFAWVREDNLLPLTLDTLLELSRDCEHEPDFLVGLKQAFVEHANICPHKGCRQSFSAVVHLRTHCRNVHPDAGYSKPDFERISRQFRECVGALVACADAASTVPHDLPGVQGTDEADSLFYSDEERYPPLNAETGKALSDALLARIAQLTEQAAARAEAQKAQKAEQLEQQKRKLEAAAAAKPEPGQEGSPPPGQAEEETSFSPRRSRSRAVKTPTPTPTKAEWSDPAAGASAGDASGAGAEGQGRRADTAFRCPKCSREFFELPLLLAHLQENCLASPTASLAGIDLSDSESDANPSATGVDAAATTARATPLVDQLVKGLQVLPPDGIDKDEPELLSDRLSAEAASTLPSPRVGASKRKRVFSPSSRPTPEDLGLAPTVHEASEQDPAWKGPATAATASASASGEAKQGEGVDELPSTAAAAKQRKRKKVRYNDTQSRTRSPSVEAAAQREKELTAQFLSSRGWLAPGDLAEFTEVYFGPPLPSDPSRDKEGGGGRGGGASGGGSALTGSAAGGGGKPPPTIRIGDGFQATSFPNASARVVKPHPYRTMDKATQGKANAPGSEVAVFSPLPPVPSLHGVADYNDFARTRGVRGNYSKWKYADMEYAHHILYSKMPPASRSKRKAKAPHDPVITRALFDLTDTRRAGACKQLRAYRYGGLTVWTDEEKAIYRKAFQEYGKQFRVFATLLNKKTLANVIEYFYSDFKKLPDYKALKREVKDREEREYLRAVKEGFVSACDHCGVTSTPRWRVGPKNEDWCDSCFNFVQEHRRLPPTNGSGSSSDTKGQKVNLPTRFKKVKRQGKTGGGARPQMKKGKSCFACNICGKVFQLPNSLYGHMRVHADTPQSDKGKRKG